MDPRLVAAVEECTRASHGDTLAFPQFLERLAALGVESYYADLRRCRRHYYLPDGRSIDVTTDDPAVPVATSFDAGSVRAALRQSQAGTHSYRQFLEKIMAAGCPGYHVSLLGRRALYFGRTAETYVEQFPTGD